MEHDPLCPTEQCCARDEQATREFCQCTLIKQVEIRERQSRRESESSLENPVFVNPTDWVPLGIGIALPIALAAVIYTVYIYVNQIF